MIEIRGQQAADWRDLYAIRIVSPGGIPYASPDLVRAELAEVDQNCWPLVAVTHLPSGERVVGRSNLRFARGRRMHQAVMTLEVHPDHYADAGPKLLHETMSVALKWWPSCRLEITVPAIDRPQIDLLQDAGFKEEACLQQAVRIAGRLVDELVFAQLSGEAARSAGGTLSSPPAVSPSTRPRLEVQIRGGSSDDWEDLHSIWSQPSVIWGTMQIPYPSADRNRQRIQDMTPDRFQWLAAVVDERFVGQAGLMRGKDQRSHVGHIGMMVHHDYQELGVGSALMAALVDLAENWYGLHRLQLEVYTDNPRAIRLYEKNGFQREGILRAFSFRDGQFVDALVMGRLGVSR